MATVNDRKHFKDYREQTQVKHSILAAYLPAYYHILKAGNKNLVYIDGFAGPGEYIQAGTGKTFDGSPLLALQLIAGNEEFSKKVSTIFIESDDKLFDHLKARVDIVYKEHPHIRKPICRFGTFSDVVNDVLSKLKGKLAPTFLFVDPCGVRGATFKTIHAVMEYEKCEAFIFFNIDGVRRIAGLAGLSEVLVELMGSEERAKSLYDKLHATSDVLRREKIILWEYCKAFTEEIGAKYIIPFRVEHEAQQKASHYLIHATKHPLGFRIMKDVMWRRGHGEDEAGALELRQRGRTNFIPLFDSRENIKHEILEALKAGAQRASVFYEDWPGRPDDMQCEAAYRQALLELEGESKIEVLGKDQKTLTTAKTRPNRRGKPTLAKDYYIRLRN